MLKYILKRILFFIPTLLVISLLTFSLSVHSPGDPVEILLNTNSENGESSDKQAQKAEYGKMREKLHLNLPVFYFSVSSIAEPDTFYKIPEKLHRENLARLLDEYGNWQTVSDYYTQIVWFETHINSLKVPDSLQEGLIETKQAVTELYYRHEENAIRERLKIIHKWSLAISPNVAIDQGLQYSYGEMGAMPSVWKNYIPSLHWYGFQNQYHLWITDLCSGDFGVSYYKKEPVIDMIAERIAPTLVFSILSIVIAFVVSIPIGMNSAIHKGTKRDKVISIFLFALYSLPSFWIGTLFINYLTNNEYLDWFPVKGLQDFSDDAGFGERMTNYLHHMVLPLFCYVYSSFAFISRQMRGSVLNTLSQDYIRTAWAKGLDSRTVYWKHALRNSLLPVITLIASVFPSLIAGSIVIETLFTLPGLGRLAYEAEVAKDYPVIYIIMLFSAVLTLVGYLVSDILYAIADPRISYNKK
jgi:peptide/nickel transport system permease protein